MSSPVREQKRKKIRTSECKSVQIQGADKFLQHCLLRQNCVDPQLKAIEGCFRIINSQGDVAINSQMAQGQISPVSVA